MKKNILKIIIFTAIIVAAVVAGILIVGQGNKTKSNAQLDLGNKALLERNYEDAILFYDEAIKLNPKNVDAYLKIAEAYIAIGDYITACEYLEMGYDATGSEAIKLMLDAFQIDKNLALGNKYFADGDPNSAKDAYEEVLKEDPDNQRAQDGVLDCERHPNYDPDKDVDSDDEETGGSNGGNSNVDDGDGGNQSGSGGSDSDYITPGSGDNQGDLGSDEDYGNTYTEYVSLEVLDESGNRFQLPNGEEWTEAVYGPDFMLWEDSMSDLEGNMHDTAQGNIIFYTTSGKSYNIYITSEWVDTYAEDSGELVSSIAYTSNASGNTIVLKQCAYQTLADYFTGGYEPDMYASDYMYYIVNGETIQYY